MCLPLANPDLLPLHLLHFCHLQIQALCFQRIAHSFPQRPIGNSFGINCLRTLFVSTEGVPPSRHVPDLAARRSPLLLKFFLFTLLHTLLRFFASAKKPTPFFSIISALFAKNTRGVGMVGQIPGIRVGHAGNALRSASADHGVDEYRESSEG